MARLLAPAARIRRALLAAAALTAAAPSPVRAAQGTRCEELLARLGDRIADATCVVSTDLTTANPATTPANNSIPGLPAGAFTPLTDRTVIAPDPPFRTPITKVVPGVQLQAASPNDPQAEARFLLRVPDDWNGALVVAGASGTRSEFNGDFAWSDYVVQKGYAYASQNKRVLNLSITSLSSPTPPTPLSCRLNPASGVWVEFFDNGPEKPFTDWGPAIVEAGAIARNALVGLRQGPPRHTYAVGTSNGGYQVRRAIELAPYLFDGGVDWEGTFVTAAPANLLTDLPPAIANYLPYVASGFDPGSAAAIEHPRRRVPAGHRERDDVVLGAPLGAVLGGDAVPVAEAARSLLRHLRLRHRELRLRRAARRLRRRRRARGLRQHRTAASPAHHGRGHDGRAPPSRCTTPEPTRAWSPEPALRTKVTASSSRPRRTGSTRFRTGTTSRPTRTRSHSSSSSSPTRSGLSTSSWTGSSTVLRSRRASASRAVGRSLPRPPSPASARRCSCPEGRLGRLSCSSRRRGVAQCRVFLGGQAGRSWRP